MDDAEPERQLIVAEPGRIADLFQMSLINIKDIGRYILIWLIQEIPATSRQQEFLFISM